MRKVPSKAKGDVKKPKVNVSGNSKKGKTLSLLLLL